jgi:hypothetical protein
MTASYTSASAATYLPLLLIVGFHIHVDTRIHAIIMTVATETAVGSNGVATVDKSVDLNIIDIRCDAVEINIKEEINSLFKAQDAPRRLPTLLLYNERGLQLFEAVRLLPLQFAWNCRLLMLNTC